MQYLQLYNNTCRDSNILNVFKEELHNNVTDYKKICQTDYNFIIFNETQSTVLFAFFLRVW